MGRTSKTLLLWIFWTLLALCRGQLINITVADVNVRIPEFENSTYSVSIQENIAKYTEILQVQATYPDDATATGKIVYGFSSRTPNFILQHFGIDSTSGQLYVRGEIDYEEGSSYNFDVEATDKGNNTGPAHALVRINVIDINDNSPQIKINSLTTSPNAEVLETVPIGTFVAHISVEDPDGGQNGKVTCSLNDNWTFALQRISDKMYKVVTAKPLNREVIPMYQISVRCQDKGIPPLVSYRYYNVTVLDDNDNIPRFTRRRYEVNMNENNAIGQAILTVIATDEDSGDNGKVEYQLHTDAANYFKINRYTGTITANQILDREKIVQIKFHVIAVDNGKRPLSSTTAVTVNVMDVNDVTPTFTQEHYKFSISENKPKGTLVGTVLARDNDTTPNSQITYSMTSGSNFFSIRPQNGQIYTKEVLNREERTQFVFDVMAVDSGYPKLHNRTTITVNVLDENDNIPVTPFRI